MSFISTVKSNSKSFVLLNLVDILVNLFRFVFCTLKIVLLKKNLKIIITASLYTKNKNKNFFKYIVFFVLAPRASEWVLCVLVRPVWVYYTRGLSSRIVF